MRSVSFIIKLEYIADATMRPSRSRMHATCYKKTEIPLGIFSLSIKLFWWIICPSKQSP